MKVYVHWFLALQELSDWRAYWEGQPTDAQRARFIDLPLMSTLLAAGRDHRLSPHLFNTMELEADHDLVMYLKEAKGCRVYERLHQLKPQYDNYEDYCGDLTARQLN
jgi:hypothetical protein